MGIQPGFKIDHYVINGLLAKGGMGVVWNAWDMERNIAVAIKAVSNDLTGDPGFRLRLQDEARRHQRLEHPNIVPVLDVFDTEKESCIVMALIEGPSLEKMIKEKEEGRFSPGEAIAVIGEILMALDHAHRHGIIHRDIKPSNILIDEDETVKIIDFGIALAAGEERRTRTGQFVGTPSYMSPEQITNPRNIDHRSDVYNVGCVFYEMLTGRPPFVTGEDGVGDTSFAIQEAHVSRLPVSPKKRVPSISASLDKLVMSALEKDPQARMPGCQEFMRLLEQAQTPQTTGIWKFFPFGLPPAMWKLTLALVVVLFILLFLLYRGQW